MRSFLLFAGAISVAAPSMVAPSIDNSCHGQVVQLPAVGSFQVSTAVSVPDQGTASLGGGGRSNYGTVTRGAGPLSSSARGGISSANSASVSATVIDLAAMDEAILNMPAGSTNVPNYATPNQGTKIVNTLVPHHYERQIKRHAPTPHPYDWMVALGPQGNDQYDSAENRVLDGSNVRYFMEKAAQAHAAGHAAAARVYYQMAVERLSVSEQTRLAEVKAARTKQGTRKSKNGQPDAKTATAAPTTPSSTATGGSVASPFDAPAEAAGAKTDMNSEPF